MFEVVAASLSTFAFAAQQEIVVGFRFVVAHIGGNSWDQERDRWPARKPGPAFHHYFDWATEVVHQNG